MRDIKFRGKRFDNGEWVYGYLFSYGINSFIVGEKDFICYENNSTAPTICELRTFGNRVIPETVGQFTGLKDKNGKEIYEGDIVRTADGNMMAIIKIGECYPEPVKKFCEFHGIKNHKIHCLHAYDKDGEYLIEDNKSLEIIGDMFGNPELLEANNENNNN